MSRKPGNYQYQKITTTTRTVTLPNQNKYSEERKTISTSNSRGGSRTKVDLNTLNKSENVQFFKCNRCGKLKYNINEKQTSLETGSWSKRSEMTEINRKTRSYEKYGTATNPKCTCGKDHSNCICGKGQYSVTTTVTKRSDNVKGQIDLTPKLKINLTPDKIRKAVEEQRRIAQEDKKRRANRTININTEENSRRYVKEERYSYKKNIERNIKMEDLCDCGDENCRAAQEVFMKGGREEELRRARLMEDQRMKRIEEERIKKIRIEEEERKRKLEEERKRKEAERRRKMEEEERLRR